MKMTTLMEKGCAVIREEFADEVSFIYNHVSARRRYRCDIAGQIRRAVACMINTVVENSAREFSLTENNGGFQTLIVWKKGINSWSLAGREDENVEYVHVFQCRGEAWETLAGILGCGDDESIATWDGNEAGEYRENGTLGKLLTEANDAEEIVGTTARMPETEIAFAMLFGGERIDWEG